MRLCLLFILSVVVGVSACKKETNSRSPIPEIEFQSLINDTVKAGSPVDSIGIVFKFKDGDADIGSDVQSPDIDIWAISTRTVPDSFYYQFPPIPEEFKDPKIGLEGTTLIAIKSAFLRIEDTSVKSETFRFRIHILDKARHPSNTIETPEITILQ
jgi:hypothetical protein